MKSSILFALVSAICFLNFKMTSSNQSGNNLILNPDFEINGKPSTTYWYGKSAPTLAKDSLNQHGQYCLSLHPQWYPNEGYAETYITDVAGNHEYEFSAWIKNMGGKGKIYIIHRANNKDTQVREIKNDSPGWSKAQTNFSASTLRKDTIVIRLSAGSSEVRTWETLFGQISLEIKK